MMPVQENLRIPAELPKNSISCPLKGLIVAVAAVAGAALGFLVAGLAGLAIGAIATIFLATYFIPQAENILAALQNVCRRVQNAMDGAIINDDVRQTDIAPDALALADPDLQDPVYAKNLIDFYQRLRLAGKPEFQGTIIEQAQKIQTWMRQSPEVLNRQKLRLTHLEITELPKEISLFRKLRELGLSGNQLRNLPPSFATLDSLTRLDLGENLFEELPLEICNLQSLTDLSLEGNQLRTLPPEIENLKCLCEFILTNNQLEDLPAEIGKLPRLIELCLSNNKLQTLPPEIGDLPFLLNLRLEHNQFKIFPSEICALKTLTGLDLSCNQLQTLPPKLGNLPTLRLLDLSYNQFNAIPEVIRTLSSLNRLYLFGNQLEDLPLEIGHLHKLLDSEGLYTRNRET